TQRGSDTFGDLILGAAALDDYLQARRTRIALPPLQRAARYPRLAAEVMEGGLPGSSAHGEHPKFTALLLSAVDMTHVLVKFSPPVDTAAGIRWSDLLVAEHHAHAVLAASGVAAASSSILQFGDRTYLEVNR